MGTNLTAPRNRISTTGSDTVTGITVSKYVNAEIEAVAAAVAGITKYTIADTEDIANIHKGLQITMAGCTNSENNGTFVIRYVSDTIGDKYIEVESSAGVIEASAPAGANAEMDLTLHAMHVLPLTDSETEFEVDMSLAIAGTSGRVDVTQTATAIPSAGLLNRKTFLIYNNGAASIDLGWNNSITFGSHMVLIAGASITIDISEDLTLYGIADTGVTVEITYIEVS